MIDSRPNIRELVVSGYADAAAFAPNIPHLTKPFRVDDLVALLNHGKASFRWFQRCLILRRLRRHAHDIDGPSCVKRD